MFGRKREDPPPPPPPPMREQLLEEEARPAPRPLTPTRPERAPEITVTKIDALITGAVQLNDDFSLRISGEVEGDLVAINADVELGRRAEIKGTTNLKTMVFPTSELTSAGTAKLIKK